MIQPLRPCFTILKPVFHSALMNLLYQIWGDDFKCCVILLRVFIELPPSICYVNKNEEAFRF